MLCVHVWSKICKLDKKIHSYQYLFKIRTLFVKCEFVFEFVLLYQHVRLILLLLLLESKD